MDLNQIVAEKERIRIEVYKSFDLIKDNILPLAKSLDLKYDNKELSYLIGIAYSMIYQTNNVSYKESELNNDLHKFIVLKYGTDTTYDFFYEGRRYSFGNDSYMQSYYDQNKEPGVTLKVSYLESSFCFDKIIEMFKRFGKNYYKEDRFINLYDQTIRLNKALSNSILLYNLMNNAKIGKVKKQDINKFVKKFKDCKELFYIILPLIFEKNKDMALEFIKKSSEIGVDLSLNKVKDFFIEAGEVINNNGNTFVGKNNFIQQIDELKVTIFKDELNKKLPLNLNKIELKKLKL